MGQSFDHNNPQRVRNLALTIIFVVGLVAAIIGVAIHFTMRKKRDPSFRFTGIQIQYSEHSEVADLITPDTQIQLTYESARAFAGDVQWILKETTSGNNRKIGSPQATNKFNYTFPATAYYTGIEFEVQDVTNNYQSFTNPTKYLVEPLLNQISGLGFRSGDSVFNNSPVRIVFDATGFADNPISKANFQVVLSMQQNFSGQTFPQLTEATLNDNKFNVSFTITVDNTAGQYYWRLVSTDATSLGLDHELQRESGNAFQITNTECANGDDLCLVMILNSHGVASSQFNYQENVTLAVTVSKDFPAGQVPVFKYRTTLDGSFTVITDLSATRQGNLISAAYVLPGITTNAFQIEATFQSSSVQSSFVQITPEVTLSNFEFSTLSPLGLRDSRYFVDTLDPIANLAISSSSSLPTVTIDTINPSDIETFSIGFSENSVSTPTTFQPAIISSTSSTSLTFLLYLNAQSLGLFEPMAAVGSQNRQHLWIQYKLQGSSEEYTVGIRDVLVTVAAFTPKHSVASFYDLGAPDPKRTVSYVTMQGKSVCFQYRAGNEIFCRSTKVAYNKSSPNYGVDSKSDASTFFIIPKETIVQDDTFQSTIGKIYVLPDNWGPDKVDTLQGLVCNLVGNVFILKTSTTPEDFNMYSSSLAAHGGLPENAYKDYMYLVSNTVQTQQCVPGNPGYPVIQTVGGCGNPPCTTKLGHLAYWGSYLFVSALIFTDCIALSDAPKLDTGPANQGCVLPAFYNIPTKISKSTQT